MEISLPTYRRLVIKYFQMEFSDRPLKQLLLQCPHSFEEKINRVIRLHHTIRHPPAEAAAFIARLLKPRLKTLIIGQADM